MRTYEPIWVNLKTKKQVSITANKALHARIIKAVKKEKWLDTEWKVKQLPLASVLAVKKSSSILTFFLYTTIARLPDNLTITVNDI